MTDQQRWDALGCVNPMVKTPNLDRLAARGLRFTQAVCQAPLCVPSRHSMMFGLYPSQLGIRTNADGFYQDDRLPAPVLAEYFQRAGYQTAGFGKTHWNNGTISDNPTTRGFEIRAVGQPRASSCYEHGALMMDDDDPEGLAAYNRETGDYGPGEENSKGYTGCTSTLKNEQHRDGWTAMQALKFLESGVDPARPLFFYLSFIKPHAGFNVPKEFEDLYRLEDIPDVPQPPWITEPAGHIDEGNESEFGRARYREWAEAWENLSPLDRRRTTLRYWANCSWLDSYFGEVLERLESLGRLENSLIIFTSDHGDMMGERHHRFSKFCLYDSSVRVPLIVGGSLLQSEKRGTTDDRLAELVDIVPTALHAAGINGAETLPGLDLLGAERRPGAFCEYHGMGLDPQRNAPAWMWRNRDWKLIIYLPGKMPLSAGDLGNVKGELYHLATDPDEWNNRYDDPASQEVRNQLTKELMAHLGWMAAR